MSVSRLWRSKAAGIALPVLVSVLSYLSPRRLRILVDVDGEPLPGSISEKIRVTINGTKQGMFIEGRDATNPVLLFIHGGPGMPEYFLNQTHPSGLEENFVVCWWEQRGAGLSYTPGMKPESLTVERLISDTIAVADYLRERFGRDKIYLMGHSWGSFLGIQVAERAANRFCAYIGMGQVTHQARSEVLSYEYELQKCREKNDSRMVKMLEAAPVTPDAPMPKAYLRIRDQVMHSLGVGTTRDMNSVISGVFLAVWKTRAYTIRERVNIWRGKSFSRDQLWTAFQATDLTAEVRKLQLPVYFFHGKYDYTVSYTLARAYFNQLEAPLRGFYTFERSAHSPIFEEPEYARRILLEDVLAGRSLLSDSI